MSSMMQASASVMPLEYPQSVAVYATYAEAQKAVDHLADNGFPVQNLCIVGTDLKQVERVLGRRTWGSVIAGGVVSGLGTGLLFALVLSFLPGYSMSSALVFGLAMGVMMGLLSAVMAQAATRGQRDFASVQAIVATRYEVLAEHKVIDQARQMLGVTAPQVWPPSQPPR